MIFCVDLGKQSGLAVFANNRAFLRSAVFSGQKELEDALKYVPCNLQPNVLLLEVLPAAHVREWTEMEGEIKKIISPVSIIEVNPFKWHSYMNELVEGKGLEAYRDYLISCYPDINLSGISYDEIDAMCLAHWFFGLHLKELEVKWEKELYYRGKDNFERKEVMEVLRIMGFDVLTEPLRLKKIAIMDMRESKYKK